MACIIAITSFSVLYLALFAHPSCDAGFVQTRNSPSDLFNDWFISMNPPVVGGQGSEVWDVGACRTGTLVFKDGRSQALQLCYGVYTHERVLQELDLVISEARENGNRLILCRRLQYIRWPTDLDGDAFHTNRVVNSDFKEQIKRVLTRMNTVTGVAYTDEPAIMGLKLIISLHPQGGLVDPHFGELTSSGWIQNMANFVKSIDGNHLLTVGVEENGGSNMRQKKAMNPRYQRRLLDHEESPPPSLVVVSHVKAAVPPSQASGCTKIPTNESGHCPNH